MRRIYRSAAGIWLPVVIFLLQTVLPHVSVSRKPVEENIGETLPYEFSCIIIT